MVRLKQLIGWLGLVSLPLLVVPVNVGAVDFKLTPAASGNIGNITDNNISTFSGLANRGISIILFIGGAAAVLYLLWSGFQYVTAGGDDEKAGKARKGIINAIIGIVIISAAFLIFNASAKVVGTTNNSALTGNAVEL